MIPDFPHNIRIRLAQLNLLRPDIAKSLPCWLSQFRKAKLRQPTGKRLSNVRTQQKKFQSGQSYSYIMRKVWYHQIWIQNHLGFIVSDLTYMPTFRWVKRFLGKFPKNLANKFHDNPVLPSTNLSRKRVVLKYQGKNVNQFLGRNAKKFQLR